MIPIIQDIVKSCETKDTLSEFGFLGGMLVAGYGAYTLTKPRNKSSGLTAVITGSAFMIGSYIVGNINSKCQYQYQYKWPQPLYKIIAYKLLWCEYHNWRENMRKSTPTSRLPRHIQSGRNLQMAGASYCDHCGLAVADEFRDSHMKELHGCQSWTNIKKRKLQRWC